MLKKSSISTILITLLIADIIFALLAIPFAMTIISSAVYEDSFGDYLEFISTISFVCFAVTTIAFAVVSFVSGRLPENKKAFDVLVKQLAKSLSVRFKKKASITGQYYEATYQGLDLKVSLESGGGKTVSKNFINIILYHGVNLNMGLSMKNKNVTLLSRDEYRDLAARRVNSSERAFEMVDTFAIRNNLAGILINTERVIESVSNIISDLKAIGVEADTSDKLLGIGSGFIVNDKFICIRMLEEAIDEKNFKHLSRLVSDACHLSRAAASLRLSPNPRSLIPVT